MKRKYDIKNEPICLCPKFLGFYFDAPLMYYTSQISLHILVAGNTYYRNLPLYLRHAAMQFTVDSAQYVAVFCLAISMIDLQNFSNNCNESTLKI